MAKVKYTFAEASLKISNLDAEENALMKLIAEARKRVLAKAGVDYKRVTVALEAGVATAQAVKFLPLIEAVERGPGQEPAPHDPGATTPLPDPLADAIKEMQSVINRFGNTVGGLMRDSLNKEHERTRSAFEPRMLAAEVSLRDMIFQKNDYEEAAGDIATDYEKLNGKYNDAKEYIEKLDGDVTFLQIQSVQNADRATQLAEEVKRLCETNLDEQEIHRQEIERIRKEYAAALKFEQDRLAALIEAFIRKEKNASGI